MGVIMHKGIAYGGGSNVEANPAGSATDDLSKIGIDGTVYDITDADAVHSTDIGVASGVASLDSNGKVPTAQLPTYPTVNNGTMTIQKNGSTVATFTANQSGNATANISVPTQPSDINAAAESDIESTKSTSGNPITITDAAPINAEKLEVVLEPKQDLHGQSYPYVGGAGKNKFDFDTTYASYKQSDGSYRLTGSNVHGIYNYISSELVGKQLTFSAYIDCSKETSPNYIRIYAKVNGQHINGSDMGRGNKGFIKVTFTPQSTSDYFGFTYGNSGGNYFTMSELQLEEGSERTSYAPYSNICPISGYDSVSVDGTGVNVWDEEWEVGTFQSNTINSKNYIPVLPNTTYYCKCASTTSGVSFYAAFYDADKNVITGMSYLGINSEFTTASNVYFMKFRMSGQYGTTYNHDISINYPSTDHDYHPYQSTTASITFGQTVYGGTVDFKTGVVTVDRALLDLGTDATFEYVSALAVDNIFPFRVSNRKYDSAAIAPISDKIKVTKKTSWSIDENEIIYIDQQDSMRIRIPNCTTVAQIETATTGMHLCYELATPTTLKLTPQELKLLQNTNNINTNGTTITLGYQQNNVVGELKGEIEQAANNFTYALLVSDETSCSLAYTDDYTSINVEIPLVQTYTDTQTQQNYTVDYTNCEFAINGVDIICADYQHDWVLGAEWKVIPQIGSAFKQDGKLKVSVYLRNWKLTSSDNTIRYVTLMLDTLAFGKYIDSRTL